MNSLPSFVQLFSLGDAAAAGRINERLALLLRDAAAYQAQFAAELAERGIEAALSPQELRDVALIDALLSEELLWESDWQDSAADMAEGIGEILARQGRPLTLALPPSAGRGAGGPEALDAVQEALEPLGLALVLFTLDSDSYPLSVVADAQAEEARQLAQALGFTLAVY